MLISALALVCLPQVKEQTAFEITPESAPYFAATKSVVIPSIAEGAATDWTLRDFVHAYEEATGHLVVATPAAEKILRLRPDLCEDEQPTPPGEVQAKFERWMEGRGLVLLPANPAAPRLIGLAARSRNDRASLPLEPYAIDWTDADDYTDHVCTLFRTIVPVQGADGRRLSNELRGHITDANVCQAVPLFGANCVLIQGPGNEVARLTRAFREPAVEAGLKTPPLEISLPEPSPDPSLVSNAGGLQLTIPARGAETWNVTDLCAAYSKLTGSAITVPSPLTSLAESTLVGLSQDLSLTGFEVTYTFEFLLRAKGFFLTPGEASGSLVLGHLDTEESIEATPRALTDLNVWAYQPTGVVEVDFPMRNFDPRIVANVMRAFSIDTKIQGVKVEPGSQALTMRGFAPQVAGKVALFRKAEALADAIRAADPNREE